LVELLLAGGAKSLAEAPKLVTLSRTVAIATAGDGAGSQKRNFAAKLIP
jgi:hypothetical protein